MLIDGIRTGVQLDKREYVRVFRNVTSRGGVQISGGAVLSVEGKRGNAVITCSHKGDGYFLNIVGNPINWLTGQNVYGTMDISRILLFWERLGFAYPADQIYIHKLAVAGYSKPIGDVRKYLNIVDCVYAAVLDHNTIKDFVGVQVHREGVQSLRFDRKKGKHKYWSLGLYNKRVEVDHVCGTDIGAVFDDRLRFDLTLHCSWLSNNKIFRVSDIPDNAEVWAQRILSRQLTRLKINTLLSSRIKDKSANDAASIAIRVNSMSKESRRVLRESNSCEYVEHRYPQLELDINFGS